MSLTAAVLGVEPEDRADLLRTIAQTQSDVEQQISESARRKRIGKKPGGIFVFLGSIAPEDLREIGGEIAFLDRSGENVRAWLSDVEYGVHPLLPNVVVRY